MQPVQLRHSNGRQRRSSNVGNRGSWEENSSFTDSDAPGSATVPKARWIPDEVPPLNHPQMSKPQVLCNDLFFVYYLFVLLILPSVSVYLDFRPSSRAWNVMHCSTCSTDATTVGCAAVLFAKDALRTRCL